MYNLLVETIIQQAKAGAFGSLGSIESVEVTQGSGGSSFDSTGSGSILPAVLGVVAALVAVGCLYWFCCRGGGDDEANPKAHNEDTSDEEHSSDEEDNRGLPVAEVVHVEDPAAAKKGTYAKK
jgi:hypothetical protein